jgi:hypothetical protein
MQQVFVFPAAQSLQWFVQDGIKAQFSSSDKPHKNSSPAFSFYLP